MSFRSHCLRKQAGDTIVEVLLAIAVAGSVLGIAYAIMNKNIKVIQNNQERTEATKIAQGQLEAVKAAWGTGKSDLLNQISLSGTNDHGFCMAGGAVVLLNNGSAPDPDNGTFTASDYPEGCKAKDGIFFIGARYLDGERLYVSVRWQSLEGRFDQVSYYYGLE